MNIYKIENGIVISIVIAESEQSAKYLCDYTDEDNLDISIIGTAQPNQKLEVLIIKGNGEF